MSVKDKSWELVQEKVFKAWLNDTLAKRDEALKVDDIYKDVADGKRMANFLELLSAKKFPYWKQMVLEKPSRIQQIQNNNHVLAFLQKEMAMKNPGCSPEDLTDGKVKYILGLLYTLFRKFRIAVISHQDKSSEEALLLWVKNVTDGYNGVSVDSFKTSFKDGLAFLAMVHRFNPEKTGVKFDDHKKDEAKKNLSVAFDLAEKELGVPKLLDVDEVMDGTVDERSVVLYTSLFFHAFKAADVASDLNKQRQSVEDSLAFEKKRNDELGQTNAQLDEKVAFLTLELDTINNKFHELEQQSAADRAKIASLEEKIKQLTHDLQLKEESYLKVNQEKLALQSELDELKRTLASEIAKREETEKKAAERQAQDETKIQELKKKTAMFEDEIESLKNEVHNFKGQLDTERKDKEEQRKLLDEHSSQDTVHRRGLQVLKRNLDQHIEDLTTWRGYLEAKDKAVFDFETEIRRALEGDLEGKDFVEQLNHLSGKLDGENELMLKLLKQKMADAIDAKKAAAAKK